MKEILENFGINSTFYIQLINFLVLMLIVVKWGLKPVQNMLEKRRQVAKKLLEKEKQLEQEKSKLEEEYKKKMADAEKHAAQIINEAKEYADELKRKVGEELYEFKQREMASFKKYMKQKTQEFKKQIEAQVLENFTNSLGGLLQEDPKIAEHITKALVNKISEDIK